MKDGALKLGSSGTLDGMKKVIAAFYCTSKKDLRQVDPTTWDVVNPDGAVMTSVIVRLRGKRYVLESRPKP